MTGSYGQDEFHLILLRLLDVLVGKVGLGLLSLKGKLKPAMITWRIQLDGMKGGTS